MKKLLLILMLLIPSMALADITKQLTTAGTDCSVPTNCVTHNIAGYAGATVTLSGTFIATVQFEASSDGTIWSAITGYAVATGTGVTAATATGNWQFNAGGLKFLRVRCSAITTPPTVNIVGSAGSYNPPASTGAITVGAVDQGTGGASAWLVTGTGGTFPVTGTVTSSGTASVTQTTSPWIVAGGGTAGTPGTAVLTVQGVGSGTAVPISGTVTTSGTVTATMATGCTPYSFISTTSANLTSVVGSAATLCTLTVLNPGATIQYLRLYNKASAPDPSACSVNSDCPVIYAPIPADSGSLGSGFTIPLGPYGMAFSLGIGYSISGAACTVVSTCTDETSSAAGITLILGYK